MHHQRFTSGWAMWYIKRFTVVSLALTLLLTSVVALFADPGDLDSSFDNDGVKLDAPQNGPGGDFDAGATIFDGSRILVGTNVFNGSPTAFVGIYSDNGASMSNGNQTFANARIDDIVLLENGKILAIGAVVSQNPAEFRDFFHVLLTDMGNNFVASDPFPQSTSFFGTSDDVATTVARTSNGGFILAGYSRYDNLDHAAWVRLDQNLNLDTSIGNTGRVIANLNPVGGSGDSRILDVVVQPDGKILTTGYSTRPSGERGMFVMRFNTDGTPDGNFGQGGILFSGQPNPQNPSVGVEIALIEDPSSANGEGRIALLSYGKFAGGQSFDMAFSVLNVFNGSSDQALPPLFIDFNNQDDIATSMTISPDEGLVVIAGTSKTAGSPENAPSDSALARIAYSIPMFQPAILDETFGNAGKILMDLPGVQGNPGDERIDNILIQPDGKILAGGVAKPGGPSLLMLARFENGAGSQLEITQEPSAENFKPGDPISYVLNFTAGNEDASVVITDVLPSEIMSPTYEVSNGVVVTPTGTSPYVWDAFVPAGGGSIMISGFISDTIDEDTLFSNQAFIAMGELVSQSPERLGIVDVTPPSTTLLETPPNVDNDVTPTFTFTGEDPTGSGLGGFECSVDSAGYATCASPFTTDLGGGAHSFEVRAIDNVGYVDTTPVSYTWTIETMVITPTETSSQSFESSDGVTATITVPAGAVDFEGAVEIGFKTVVTTGLPTAPSAGTLVAGFDIDLLVDGDVEEGVVFDKPITLTLAYDGDLVTNPEKVTLYYLNSEGEWSSDGITVVEPIGNPLVVQISHLTSFGIVEQSDQMFFYLPMLDQAIQPTN